MERSAQEIDAAVEIARCLREQAASLPVESRYRALMLRSAARWDRLAAIGRLIRPFEVIDGEKVGAA